MLWKRQEVRLFDIQDQSVLLYVYWHFLWTDLHDILQKYPAWDNQFRFRYISLISSPDFGLKVAIEILSLKLSRWNVVHNLSLELYIWKECEPRSWMSFNWSDLQCHIVNSNCLELSSTYDSRGISFSNFADCNSSFFLTPLLSSATSSSKRFTSSRLLRQAFNIIVAKIFIPAIRDSSSDLS